MLLQDSAYLLFSRPQGETSLWLSILTESYGRIQLTFKGGQKKQATLPPFLPLSLAWRSGKQGSGWLSHGETSAYYPPLTGMANWSGLYANELLHRGLLTDQPVAPVFNAYAQLMESLSSAGTDRVKMAWALRRFEWVFIAEMGYGLSIHTNEHQLLNRQTYYQWQSDGWQQSNVGIQGAELLALMEQSAFSQPSSALRELLQWRLLQAMPSQALSMRQWWEQLK